MLGCTLTHAHKNIVAKQLQTMSQVDRRFGQFGEPRMLPGDGDDMRDKIGSATGPAGVGAALLRCWYAKSRASQKSMGGSIGV